MPLDIVCAGKHYRARERIGLPLLRLNRLYGPI